MRESPLRSGQRDARSHQADAVHFGLLARIFFGAFAGLVALVEQFDLLQFLEGFAEASLGVLELNPQFVGRALQVLAALDRRLGIGRIGEMRGILMPARSCSVWISRSRSVVMRWKSAIMLSIWATRRRFSST